MDAKSVDLEPAEDNSVHHYVADAFDVIDSQWWDLVIAHPPCTYLCAMGTFCMYGGCIHRGHDDEYRLWRREQQRRAINDFRTVLNAPADRIAVENPIMMRSAVLALGVEPTSKCQPWWFGDPYTKATCWWLVRLQPLTPTNRVKPIGPWVGVGMQKHPGLAHNRARTAPARFRVWLNGCHCRPMGTT